ncbi:hypothetical protein JCM19239_4490 [Vibrio variabilis]|uniref:Uncharacterized protein n=1 Tax=Vibrio variabilis TaxID=990271 RepID=A0ABQ0JQR5_9VIBR|nr:hypothetical protein JCM19239_4490 [Vibrio variabilis]
METFTQKIDHKNPYLIYSILLTPLSLYKKTHFLVKRLHKIVNSGEN